MQAENAPQNATPLYPLGVLSRILAIHRLEH